jgi:hypothetical protein
MTQFKAIVGVAFSAALLVGPVRAQTPGSAIPDALRSLLGELCWTPTKVDTTRIDFFPAVRFSRGTCNDEHGDQRHAIVGLDSDSVFYLLASEQSFNFLVDRHPLKKPIAATGVLSYAQIVLELSGQSGPRPRFAQSWNDLPLAARDSARNYSVQPVQIHRSGRFWQLRVFTVLEGVFGPYIDGFDVSFDERGRFATVRPEWHWQARPGP